jgi:hypothetical protein
MVRSVGGSVMNEMTRISARFIARARGPWPERLTEDAAALRRSRRRSPARHRRVARSRGAQGAA